MGDFGVLEENWFILNSSSIYSKAGRRFFEAAPSALSILEMGIESVNRLVDSLLWEKRERKPRRDVKPKQRKDVVIIFSKSILLYKKSLCGLR